MNDNLFWQAIILKISIILIKFLFSLFQNYEHKHRTKVFVMYVTEELGDWEDSRNMNRKRQWFTIDDALIQLSLHKPVQRRYLQQLKNSKNLSSSIQQQQQQTRNLSSSSSSSSPTTTPTTPIPPPTSASSPPTALQQQEQSSSCWSQKQQQQQQQ